MLNVVPTSGFAFNIYGAVVLFYHGFGDGKSKPAACYFLCFTVFFDTYKILKDFLAVFLAHADA